MERREKSALERGIKVCRVGVTQKLGRAGRKTHSAHGPDWHAPLAKLMEGSLDGPHMPSWSDRAAADMAASESPAWACRMSRRTSDGETTAGVTTTTRRRRGSRAHCSVVVQGSIF